MRRSLITMAAAAAIAASSILGSGTAIADPVYTVGGTGSSWFPSTKPWSLPFAPGEETQIKYPAAIFNMQPGIDAGAAQLVSRLSNGGSATAVGISQGALVLNAAERALMEMPAELRPAAGDLVFIHIADPSGPTGIMRHMPVGSIVPVVGAEVVAPVDTPYHTIYIVRQYDGLADAPVRFNVLAIANAAAGVVYVHADRNYANVDLDTAVKTVTTNSAGGTVTQYLIPTKVLPILRPLHDIGIDTRGMDAALRPIIESAYDRPATQPKPKVEPETEPESVPKAKAEPKRENLTNVVRRSLKAVPGTDHLVNQIDKHTKDLGESEGAPKVDVEKTEEPQTEPQTETKPDTESDNEAA